MKGVFNEIMTELPRWLKFIVVFTIGSIFGSIVTFLTIDEPQEYQPDNIVEELVEEVIQNYTGQDIDLSPGSPETKAPLPIIRPSKRKNLW